MSALAGLLARLDAAEGAGKYYLDYPRVTELRAALAEATAAPARSLDAGYLHAAVYTTPHPTPDLDPGPALVAALALARRTISFGIYSLTLPAVADAIIAAHQRGVTVRGVMDAGEYRGKTSLGARLVAAGVDLRLWGHPYVLMHDKVAVIDGTTVVLGSYNWTTSAEKSNVEVMLVAAGVQTSRVLAPALTAQLAAAYDAAAPPAPPVIPVVGPTP